jgi:hypothetical protein
MDKRLERESKVMEEVRRVRSEGEITPAASVL